MSNIINNNRSFLLITLILLFVGLVGGLLSNNSENEKEHVFVVSNAQASTISSDWGTRFYSGSSYICFCGGELHCFPCMPHDDPEVEQQ